MEVPVGRFGGVVLASGQDTRQANLRRVLDAVASGTARSRADVARTTGLTRGTISILVGELIDAGLLVEAGVGPSDGGKPPTLLALRPDARFIIAIGIGPPHVVGTLSDLAGTVVAREQLPDEEVTGEDLFEAVAELALSLRAAAPGPVAGIGVGTAGLVTAEGTVIEASNLDWHGLPLAKELGTRMGLPVWVVNSADAAALAEYQTLPDDASGLAVVRMGTGVGAGLILNGKLHAGDRAAAGEIGHLVVDPDGPPCSCGNRGCLETIASARAVLAGAAEAGGFEPPDELPGNVDALREQVGTAEVDRLLRDAGLSLGTVLAHLVAIVDITHVVLSPELEGDIDPLFDAVRETLAARLLPGHAAGIDVRASTLIGEDLVLRGAHALVLAAAFGLSRVSRLGIATAEGGRTALAD